MREILFRGKTLDDCEWVYGYYVKQVNANEIYCLDDCEFERRHVDPATVGQYTGMTDKNGKKIFEGDIVSFKRENAFGYTQFRVGDVRYFDELPVFYIMATTGDAWDWCFCKEITVIGNRWDNPELLEDAR